MSFRPLWIWRLLLLAFAVVYLASIDLQAWLPPIVPFAAAAAVEAQFFLAGVRSGRRRRAFADPGPQQRDLDELGWKAHTITVRLDEAELVLRPGELDDEEIAEWLDVHRDELVELGPGHHELAAIDAVASPVVLQAPPVGRQGHRTRTRLLQALGVLALFAGLFFLDTRAEHWQHLSTSARAATVDVLDQQASRIAGHRANVICDVDATKPPPEHLAETAARTARARDGRSPCSRTRPGTCRVKRAKRSPTVTRTSPVSGSERHSGSRPRPHAS